MKTLVLLPQILWLTLMLVTRPALASLQKVANEEYYQVLMQELSREDLQTVDVIHFRFSKIHDPKLRPHQIFKRLVQLHQKGTRVRLFLDNHHQGNQATIELLQSLGLPVKFTSNEQISHTKSICFNSETLLLGSTNWTHTSLSANNEINVLIKDKALAGQYTTYFEKLWAKIENRSLNFPPVTDTRLVTDREFGEVAHELIRGAKQSLDVATYFLAYREGKEQGDDRLIGELLELLAQKIKQDKIKLRLFLDYNGIIGPNRTPDHLPHTAGAIHGVEYLKSLVGAENQGLIEVYFDSFRKISHGKFLIADAQTQAPVMLTGSTNLYWRDIESNLQLNLLTKNSKLISEFSAYFTELLAQSGHYYRFWRGIKRQYWNTDVVKFYEQTPQDNSCLWQALQREENKERGGKELVFNTDDFACLLNLWLIPATPSYSAQTSLQAYLPVLTKKQRPIFLPDEVAIIVYNNQKEYLRLRTISGKEGQTYGPLHMDVFGQSDFARASRSLVPQIFVGTIKLQEFKEEKAQAYDLLNTQTDWQKGVTAFRLWTKRPEVSEEHYLKALENYFLHSQAHKKILGHVTTVTDKAFFEYVHFSQEKDKEDFFKAQDRTLSPVAILHESYLTHQLKPLQLDPLSYEPLKYGKKGEGMAGNVIFTRGQKPGQARHYRLLKD